jgi:hypothetical protein
MARAAVRTGDAREATGFFAASRRGGFPVVPDALEAALASSDRSLNAAACWHVAYTKVSGTPVPESLRVAAVKTAQTPVSSAADAGVAFACDVVARTLGGRPTAAGPWLEHLAAEDGILLPSDLIDDGRILAQLTDAELRGVAVRTTGSPDGLAKRKGTRDPHPNTPAARAGRRMRLASGFTPGLLADTLRVADRSFARDSRPERSSTRRTDGGNCACFRPALRPTATVPPAPFSRWRCPRPSSRRTPGRRKSSC